MTATSAVRQNSFQKEDDAMVTAMNPSESQVMTSRQIGRIQDFLASGLRKAGLPSGLIQQVIETLGGPLTDELVAVIRQRVEALSDIIWREVEEVSRDRIPQEALDATGRVQYTNPEVVKTMPRGEGKKARVGFFKLDLSERHGCISDDDLQKEYDLRNMKPDPYAQMAVNQADPAFADSHPNGSHWKGPDGKWHCIVFRRWRDGERLVDVRRGDDGWDGRWWFAGVSK